MKKVYEFIYPIENNQSIFDVTKTELLPSIGQDVKVIKNGTTELDCIVIDDNGVSKIQLTSDSLLIEDYLSIEMLSNSLKVIGDRSDSIFRRYGSASEPRLLNNQNYIGNIIIEDIEDINLIFTSRYNPFYTTTRSIQDDIDHIVTISDDEVNYLIYDHSYRVLIKLKDSGDDTADQPTPTELQNVKTIPYNIRQHVRYSVQYDIIYAVWLRMAGKSGSCSKKLAELSVECNVKLPDLNDFLRGIQEKLNGYKLTGGVSAIQGFVKGNSTFAYPLVSPRRSF
jgi:hypothetical protein